mmetsp:Transcript_2829/g.4039  ORF Transcript_2829/g.4039 Transcript_2829/m.4039 type:complete len:290 (+) Transcript_2829:211-1080(+)
MFLNLVIISLLLSKRLLPNKDYRYDKSSSNEPTMPKAIKAILFDMDGTLLDTEALSDKAVLLAFGRTLDPKILQKPPMSDFRLPWELKKRILGLRGTDWIPIVKEYAVQHWQVKEESFPSIDKFQKSWEESLNLMCSEIEACKGATKLVEELAKAKLPMVIATSSRYAAVEKKRQRHEAIFKHMQEIVAGDDPAVRSGKPAPDIYLEAARRLNVDPRDCLVFEDALSGVQSGKAAGCMTVAIPDERFSEKEKTAFRDQGDVVLGTLLDFDGTEFGVAVNMAAYHCLETA